jgi:hypothetical protein
LLCLYFKALNEFFSYVRFAFNNAFIRGNDVLALTLNPLIFLIKPFLEALVIVAVMGVINNDDRFWGVKYRACRARGFRAGQGKRYATVADRPNLPGGLNAESGQW